MSTQENDLNKLNNIIKSKDLTKFKSFVESLSDNYDFSVYDPSQDKLISILSVCLNNNFQEGIDILLTFPIKKIFSCFMFMTTSKNKSKIMTNDLFLGLALSKESKLFDIALNHYDLSNVSSSFNRLMFCKDFLIRTINHYGFKNIKHIWPSYITYSGFSVIDKSYKNIELFDEFISYAIDKNEVWAFDMFKSFSKDKDFVFEKTLKSIEMKNNKDFLGEKLLIPNKTKKISL